MVGLAASALVAATAALCLTGCANLGYYWQSVTGHLNVMNAARPLQDWLEDPSTEQRLKDKLVLSRRIREFAVQELKLPENASYRSYADLRRPAVVWNVVAAPEYSLTLKTWCFPVTGCVSYRGYYDEQAARNEGAQLMAQGWEVSVYPVPAYSTLGWLNWLGGDPLLSTFINYPEGELARLIFHELAHQVLYVQGDSMFNESFATAVERIGGPRWMDAHATEQARREYADYDERRRQFRALTRSVREQLKDFYESSEGMEAAQRAEGKARILREFRDAYFKLRDSWGGNPARWRAYDRWVNEASNASFGTQATYDELVPGFLALFKRERDDFQRFYQAAKALSAEPKEERHRKLKEWGGG